jgi:putative endonuclease
MQPSERRQAETRGRWAEGLAAWFLRLKGYRILDRRSRTPVGEIDLVAVRARIVAFVEVKARRRRDQGLWAVTPRQARRISQAARYWIAGHPGLAGYDCRFDIVIVSPYQMPLHVADVFQDDG